MSALTDDIARATHSSVPTPPVQIRLAAVTGVVRQAINTTTASLTLYADFGSGGVQVAATQDVIDQIETLEKAKGGSGFAYATGRTAVTVTPSGNGMPIVIGYLGSSFTTIS